MDCAASNTACYEGNFKLQRKTPPRCSFPSQAVFTGRYAPLLRSSASRPANTSFNVTNGVDEPSFFRKKGSSRLGVPVTTNCNTSGTAVKFHNETYAIQSQHTQLSRRAEPLNDTLGGIANFVDHLATT